MLGSGSKTNKSGSNRIQTRGSTPHLQGFSETGHDVQLLEGEDAEALHQAGQTVGSTLPLTKVLCEIKWRYLHHVTCLIKGL